MTVLHAPVIPAPSQCPRCGGTLIPHERDRRCDDCGQIVDHSTFVLPLQIIEPQRERLYGFISIGVPLALAIMVLWANGWQHAWLWVGVFGCLALAVPLGMSVWRLVENHRDAPPNSALLFTATGVAQQESGGWTDEVPYHDLCSAEVISQWKSGYRIRLCVRSMGWFPVAVFDGVFRGPQDQAMALPEELQRRIAEARQRSSNDQGNG